MRRYRHYKVAITPTASVRHDHTLVAQGNEGYQTPTEAMTLQIETRIWGHLFQEVWPRPTTD